MSLAWQHDPWTRPRSRPLPTCCRVRNCRALRRHRSLRAKPTARTGSRRIVETCLDVVYSKSLGSILALGILLSVIFVVWVAVARAIYVANFGYEPVTSVTTFAHEILTTPQGHNVIVVGSGVGFLFAALAFSVSVVSFPLLLDRNVGVAAAALTSAKVVLRNPKTMIIWGLIVACSLMFGFLAFVFGLA